MTLLDLFFALFLGVFIYIGWNRGVVREAAALAGVLIGIWAAVHFSRLIALMLGLRGESAILIAFFIIFVGTLVLASLLGRTADRVVKAVKMNLPNKIAGAALGMIKAICICSVILNGMRPSSLAEPEDVASLQERVKKLRAEGTPGEALSEALEYAEMVIRYVIDGSGTRDLIHKAEEKLLPFEQKGKKND